MYPHQAKTIGEETTSSKRRKLLLSAAAAAAVPSVTLAAATAGTTAETTASSAVFAFALAASAVRVDEATFWVGLRVTKRHNHALER